MEKILDNPGLVHLAENIFENLDNENLKVCEQINQSSKQVLTNPIFWLRKFTALSKDNQNDWMKVLNAVKNSEKEKAIISYLQWKLKEDALVDLVVSGNQMFKDSSNLSSIHSPMDLPCYSCPAVQDDFREKIRKICLKKGTSIEDMDIIKVLAPLTENPNALDEFGYTPINYAACRGHAEIVKTMASLTENPNAPNRFGYTPLYAAVQKGHTETVKILAPLTDNPNAPYKNGYTPIFVAAFIGHTEIVKILAPLTDNPNAPNEVGETPIYWAAKNGHIEIQRILNSFITSGNPNTRPSSQPNKKRKF